MQMLNKTADVTRVTLVVPGKLWEDVKRLVPAGRRSQLVTEALEAEVNRRQQQETPGQYPLLPRLSIRQIRRVTQQR